MLNITIQIFVVLLALLQSKPEARIKLSVVDQSGNPVHATIDQRDSEPTAGYRPTFRESSPDGEIEVVTDNNAPDSCCFVYAKGFAIDHLTTSTSSSRAMRVRMQPESNIAVLLEDRIGNPIPNARIAPGLVSFRRNRQIVNVPDRLPEFFESLTDTNGKAKLLGAIASDLRSLRITLEDNSSCTFAIPKNWDRTSLIRVVWDVSFGTLICKVLDPNGQPVAGAKIFVNATEDFLNTNVIKEPKPNFKECLGKTDNQGCIRVEKAPAVPIDVRVFGPEKSIGQGEFRRDFTILSLKTNLLEFHLKPVCNCLVSVVDVTDSETHEGITIKLRIQSEIDFFTGEGRTNEDGICEVTVQPGDWMIEIDETTLPDGYCLYHRERSTKFAVAPSTELQNASPAYIGKGLLVEGKIVGLDMIELRSDRILAASKNFDQEWTGSLNNQGNFRIFVPNYVDLESVEHFASADGGVGVLTVKSKSPWVLKWMPKILNKP